MIKVFFDPGFAAPIGNHIMPIHKFELVAQALQNNPHIELLKPNPVSEKDLLRVHSKNYIDAIKTGEPRSLAESQKFPWTKALYPSVLLTNGGILSASREALKSGYSAALASGFHHSHSGRGEGFCTFNGLIVALDALFDDKLIKKAAILDMDLHYGNGTALLAQSRPWISALSIYGNDYWDNKAYADVTILQHQDGTNHRSVSLPAKCDGATLLKIMDSCLDWLLKVGSPDILLYQAGADPFFEDPYSPLLLDHADLLARDKKVFKFTHKHHIPVAWVLAGGYTQDISKVVQVHTNTFEAWAQIYDR